MQTRGRRTMALLLIALTVIIPSVANAAPASVPATSVASWNENAPEDLKASHLYAQTAVLIDAHSGEVLFSKGGDTVLTPASITKVLTALIVLERCTMEELVTAKPSTFGHVEATWFELKDGEQLSVKDMLYGLMLKSYNDCAAALAVHVGGSIQGFAEMMNRKAAELGCTDSNFVVPHGLTTDNHQTTAKDMAIIARAAMQNETFRKIVATQKYTIPPTNKRSESTTITNGNKLLPDSGTEYAYEGCIGVKTGYTNKALHTFVGAAQRDGISLICVLLGSQGIEPVAKADGKWLDAQKLFDYGFASYRRVDILALYDSAPIDYTIDNAIDGDTGILKLDLGDTSQFSGIIAPKDSSAYTSEDFKQRISVEYLPNLAAPISKGEKVATLTLTLANGQTASADLLASRDVLQAVSLAPMSFGELDDTVGAPPTLTDIAIGIEQSPTRYLALLLLVPVIILVGLVVSMIMDVSKRRRRLRGRITRPRGY